MMTQIKVLDCTLRDGGYCNQWRFGFDNAKKIVAGLVEANVDVVECGFLTNRVEYDKDTTKYTQLDQITKILPVQKEKKIFVCMVNYGEYSAEMLPPYDGTSVDGIRVAFHKKDKLPALQLCADIGKKGYKVFVQAMASLLYSDEEFLDLILRVNAIQPYAFYIVDSFGMMKRKDLIRLFYLVEHNLKENIIIGFHSHNNMQLAYSNAQTLVDFKTKRELMIDASVYGMGRGAGNLNTELFVQYLNENAQGQYRLKPLLNIVDEILNYFYQKNHWGYSLENYLSAVYNAHPDYATYLDDKKTLTIDNMQEIFSLMDSEKKGEFSKDYVEALYLECMAAGQAQEEHLVEVKSQICGKEVLVIAPGRSSVEEKEKVVAYAAKTSAVTVSINCDYAYFDVDFIFVSNLRRFRELAPNKREKCIATSNIAQEEVYLKTSYRSLLNDVEAVHDNAGAMLIQYLIKLGAISISLAGMDGYSADAEENYAQSKMTGATKKELMQAINAGLNSVLKRYATQVPIHFVTTPKYLFV